MRSTKKLVTIAILVALATVLHVAEALLPNPFPIPGAKLGLANIVTLLALILFNWKTALQIVIMRTILGSLLSGTLLTTTFFFSFAGALTSTFVMAVLCRRNPGFSTIGISVAGAAAHNIGQLAIAGIFIEQAGLFAYLPVMLMISIPTGIITGTIVRVLLSHLQKIKIITAQEKYFN